MTPTDIHYHRGERLILTALAAIGFLGINGVFLWSLFRRPEAVRETLSNPVAAVFIVEAMILVGVLAWLFRKWSVTRLAWGWFVLLSVLGSLAFSIPVALLYRRRR